MFKMACNFYPVFIAQGICEKPVDVFFFGIKCFHIARLVSKVLHKAQVFCNKHFIYKKTIMCIKSLVSVFWYRLIRKTQSVCPSPFPLVFMPVPVTNQYIK